MTKSNNKKKNKYLHIKSNDVDKNQVDYFVNAKTPLVAAKKIWRVNKDLDIIYIKDINTYEIFYFSSSTWTNNNGDKFNLNQ